MTAAARPRFAGVRMARSARVLLLVDWITPMEHEDAAALAEPALAAARNAARLKSRLCAAGVQAIYANDNYGTWQSDFHTLVDHCRRRGGAPAAIAQLLKPGDADIAVVKPRHSAFYETPLQLLLQQLGTHELIVTGIATEWCVLFTAVDAYVRGYSLQVPSDCVASGDSARHCDAIRYIGQVLGAGTRASGDT